MIPVDPVTHHVDKMAVMLTIFSDVICFYDLPVWLYLQPHDIASILNYFLSR